ncbi:hypothetical protein PMIN07_008765 [Paraphaeosphaeria minitans]
MMERFLICFRPGVFAGTTRVVCLFQGFLLSGSEQPMSMKICISWLYLQLPYSLRPLMMTSLSVISILMPTCVASDEARSGSVMLYADEKSPFISGCSHFFFCSGVQYLASSSMLPVSGAWQLSVGTGVSVPSRCRSNYIAHLSTPIHSAHDLCTARVLQVCQPRALFEVIGQEQIEQALGFGLLAQLGDDGRRRPPRLLQLRLIDALCRYNFMLDPVVDLLDLLNGNGPQLRLDPRRDARKGRVALHLNDGGHVAAVLACVLRELNENEQPACN